MNLKIEASALTKALKIANRITARRNIIPVLGTVKIEHGRMIATNLDVEAAITLPTILTGNPFTLSPSMAAKMMAGVDGSEIVRIDATSETKEKDPKGRDFTRPGRVSVDFNGSRYVLPSIPSEDFPSMRGLAPDAPQTATGNGDLVAAMRAVMFCISREETRYYLNGVCLSKDADGAPIVVATDGHRLAYHPISVPVAGGDEAIVPREAVKFLVEYGCEPDTVTMDRDGKMGEFRLPGTWLKTKLIDGTYPEWKRVLPNTAKPWLTFRPEAMIPALARIASMSSQEWRAVKVSSGDGSSAAHLSMLIGGEIEAEERVGCEFISHDAKPFVVNARYLLAALSAFKGCDTVTVHGSGPMEPFKITGEGSKLTVVQMPMRA